MFLGRVIGTVWATEKDPSLEGLKLLVVREVDLNFKAQQKFLIAVDTVQSGLGEIVLVATGSSARQTWATRDKPVDAVVMAVVDNLSVSEIASLEANYQARAEPLKKSLAKQPEI